jgi:DNA polymerase-3 subunit alpha
MPPSFAHLRVHSDYSLGRGASKVKDLVKRAVACGQPALALVDTLNMHGAMELAKYAKEAGLQPITGATVFVEAEKGLRGSMLLLAQDAAGYANVCQLVKRALSPREGRALSDALSMDDLREKASRGQLAGVIALAGCGADSVVGVVHAAKGTEAARDLMAALLSMFGDRYYAEVCRNADARTDAESDAERSVVGSADALGVPLVATSDVWYVSDAQHDAYEILRAVAQNAPASISADEDGIHGDGGARYGMSDGARMSDLFADLPDAYAAALVVARRCAFMPEGRKPILPPFETGEGRTEDEELQVQSREGLELRLDKLGLSEADRAVYRDRLEFELGVIIGMKFPGYFLIVSDFIKHAKSIGVPVGPGRGSGAGSAVAWALSITDLDPLRFGLLFERFLNPDRVSMPDFDVDFCQDGRESVIEYVKKKYGLDKVAQIATFTGLKSKGAFRDAGRVLKHFSEGALSPTEVNGITSLIPQDKENPADPARLDVAYQLAPEFAARIDDTPRARVVFDGARKIEGLFRNSSVHAAGIVIGGQDLAELVPIGFDPKSDMPVVQFNMKFAEAAGLVKFDFLGLKTLSVINLALQYVAETTGETIDISTIPLDDAPTFAMLSRGDATAVFQFESEGMRGCLRDMRASVFDDLIAAVSLFRPGPMAMIPTYCDCKLGKIEPDYPEPADKTRPILEDTYGIMVYQEQVMAVARSVAGFSLGQADLLRRAMGKKDKAEMDRQRIKFAEESEKNGVPARIAAALFDKIAHFASYGFNKSHAAAYALISYQTAWLKCHYPAEYLSAFLSYENSPEKHEKIALVKQDLDARGVPLLPPCVQRSRAKFGPERMESGVVAVRYGLAAVSGITDSPALYAERAEKGPYRDLTDFHERAGRHFNAKQITNLASVGAFEALCEYRQRANDVLTYLSKNDKGDKGADLFGGTAKVCVPRDIAERAEWDDVAEREFAILRFYLRQHPLEKDIAVLIKAQVKRRASIEAHMRARNLADLVNKKLYGLVEAVKHKTSFRGNPYLRIEVSERDDRYWISYFCKANELQQKFAVLDQCRKDRVPCAFVAKFSQGDRGDYRISVDEFMTGPQFVMRFTSGAQRVIRVDPSRAGTSNFTNSARVAGRRKLLEEIARLKAACQGPDDEEVRGQIGLKYVDLASLTMEAVRAKVHEELVEDPDGDEIVFDLTVSDAWTDVKFLYANFFEGRRYRVTTAFWTALPSFDDAIVDTHWVDPAIRLPAAA